MPWTRKKISDLNHIIAGPMVRKVNENEVSIWVAVKSPANITLKVYEPNGTSPVLTSSIPLTPVRVGKHLYIACITASSTENVLNNYSTVYGYDLEFEFSESDIKHLQSDGILDAVGSEGIKKVTYDTSSETYKLSGDKLPGFLVPPPTVNELNLFHGSCRKPHGQGVDALTVLHDRIEESINIPSVNRPQLLCFTGDQIYADDVSELLLHQIDEYHYNVVFSETETDESLIGWRENMEELHPEVTSDFMKLNERYRILKEKLDVPKVDKKAAKNHLIRFTEFILMYCMVWSDELWRDEIPSYFAMNPLPSTDTEEVKHTIKEDGQIQEHIEVHYANESSYPVSHGKLRRYAKKHAELKRFRKGLPKVRRALANISTLMVFDDHDVTDDWFFNRQWCQNLLEGKDKNGNINNNIRNLGRRLMSNGMTAIALCQTWGNDPSQFDGSTISESDILVPGSRLIDALNSINSFSESEPSTINSDWDSIETIVLPVVDDVSEIHKLTHQNYSLDWHWYYERSNYELIGLDTRTMRSFRNETGVYTSWVNRRAPGLLSDEAIDIQVKLAGKSNLSDPPLDKELTILVSGAPIFGVTVNEEKLRSSFSTATTKAEYRDLESWNLDPHARQTLISRLLERKSLGTGGSKIHRVVTLSGDVHYAYTNKLHYKANETYNTEESSTSYGIELKMGQFCASSMKNLTTGKNGIVEWLFSSTKIQHKKKDSKAEKSNEIVCGWNSLESLHDRYGKRVVYCAVDSPDFHEDSFVKPNTTPPHKANLKTLKNWIADDIAPEGSENVPSPLPDWYYELTFKVASPKVPNFTLSTPISTPLDEFEQTKCHRTISDEDGISGGSYIVGYPNIGDVTFNWIGGQMEAIHNITWINKSGQNSFDNDEDINDKYVRTQHIINLE